MAKIEEIDYDQIIAKASAIARFANHMQEEVKKAFQEIEQMRENWFGYSYDNFINTVNMSVNGFNKIFEVTVSDIPHEIAAKARSYAAANQTTVSNSLVEQTALMLTDLERTNKGSKLRFRTEEVETHRTNIKKYFDNAKEYANQAKQQAEDLNEDWRSISGDTNIAELRLHFSNLNVAVSRIENALDIQVNSQASTIEMIENATNMVKSAKENVSDFVEGVENLGENIKAGIENAKEDLWTNLMGKN